MLESLIIISEMVIELTFFVGELVGFALGGLVGCIVENIHTSDESGESETTKMAKLKLTLVVGEFVGFLLGDLVG